MDDDKKLKLLFYAIIFLSSVAIIGAWESFIQPIFKLIFGIVSIQV